MCVLEEYFFGSYVCENVDCGIYLVGYFKRYCFIIFILGLFRNFLISRKLDLNLGLGVSI